MSIRHSTSLDGDELKENKRFNRYLQGQPMPPVCPIPAFEYAIEDRKENERLLTHYIIVCVVGAEVDE
jgi:hypothetical protein